MTFEDYRIQNPASDKKQKVLNAVKDYYNDICFNYLRGNNLLLLGNWGTGKTMLSSILANKCADLCFGVKFINVVDMFEEIKDTFNNTGKIKTKYYINNHKKGEILFLDDIDKKQQPTDYIKEIFYSIINYRVENELPTVISANSNLAELDKIYGEAIVSRLAENARVVLFTHNNERLK